jgi:hypothetical protein
MLGLEAGGVRSSEVPCAAKVHAAIPRVCTVAALKREFEKSFSVFLRGSGTRITRARAKNFLVTKELQ